MHIIDSPFIIPLAGMLVGVIAIISGVMGQAHARGVKAEQRMAMIARGMKPEEIAQLLGDSSDDDRPSPRVRDPLRSLGNARRAGIILCSTGIGLVLFFCVLASVLGVREVYSGAAVGLVPIAIGIGFFIDCQLQKREMARFGLELEPPRGA